MRTIAYGDYIALGGGLKAQIKRAYVDVAAGQTAAQVIAAVAGKKIRVLALVMVAGSTATTSRFLSKPAGAGDSGTEFGRDRRRLHARIRRAVPEAHGPADHRREPTGRRVQYRRQGVRGPARQ